MASEVPATAAPVAVVPPAAPVPAVKAFQSYASNLGSWAFQVLGTGQQDNIDGKMGLALKKVAALFILVIAFVPALLVDARRAVATLIPAKFSSFHNDGQLNQAATRVAHKVAEFLNPRKNALLAVVNTFVAAVEGFCEKGQKTALNKAQPWVSLDSAVKRAVPDLVRTLMEPGVTLEQFQTAFQTELQKLFKGGHVYLPNRNEQSIESFVDDLMEKVVRPEFSSDLVAETIALNLANSAPATASAAAAPVAEGTEGDSEAAESVGSAASFDVSEEEGSDSETTGSAGSTGSFDAPAAAALLEKLGVDTATAQQILNKTEAKHRELAAAAAANTEKKAEPKSAEAEASGATATETAPVSRRPWVLPTLVLPTFRKEKSAEELKAAQLQKSLSVLKKGSGNLAGCIQLYAELEATQTALQEALNRREQEIANFEPQRGALVQQLSQGPTIGAETVVAATLLHQLRNMRQIAQNRIEAVVKQVAGSPLTTLFETINEMRPLETLERRMTQIVSQIEKKLGNLEQDSAQISGLASTEGLEVQIAEYNRLRRELDAKTQATLLVVETLQTQVSEVEQQIKAQTAKLEQELKAEAAKKNQTPKAESQAEGGSSSSTSAAVSA